MAAVLTSTQRITASNPFHMTSHPRITSKTAPQPAASSSRSPQPSASTSTASNVSATEAPEASAKTFKRIRSSLEQSLRTATRSRTKPPPVPVDDFGTVTAKGKEKVSKEEAGPKEKEKSKMLRRLESKVGFRRSGGSVTPSPSPVPPSAEGAQHDTGKKTPHPVRVAGFTSFLTPSLRQASMSSPALHLSSQALPSPKSQSAMPASSSLPSSALVSPTRERARRSSIQPTSPEISGPSALTSRRDARANGNAISPSHKPTKSRPPPLLPTSPSTPSLRTSSRGYTPSPVPDTPTRKTKDLPSPPDTPTPTPRGQLYYSSKRAAASTTHILDSPPASPTTLRASSPSVRARSPTGKSRVASPTHRSQASSSSSHIPLSSSPTPGPRRPSIDTQRVTSQSPTRARAASPSAPVRPRAASPSSPSYAQNRHFNISTASLSGPSNPEDRESIRSATSTLCKEFLKPPPHLSKGDAGAKEWGEVEVRMRALTRLERIWGKSGVGMGSSSQLSNVGALSSSGLGAGGEERERRLFSEALRDGYVLCQLMNKLWPNSIARANPREDGFVHTSNVTKFLAACSLNGVPSDDLFHRDDLIESTAASLARVAKTIIALTRLVDAPSADRSKILHGQKVVGPEVRPGPYGHGSSRAASSTPNLSIAQAQRSTSPSGPTTPSGRKRWSPPSPGLPTVRSDSPGEGGSGTSSNGKTEQQNGNAQPGRETPVGTRDGEMVDVVPPIIKPPPRSPLRTRSQSKPVEDGSFFTPYRGPFSPPERISVADSTRAVIGEPSRVSLAESSARQSIASTSVTDTTAFSSLLDLRRNSSSGHNKYGTIRTVTTEATSADAPSLTRTEGSSVAASLTDEMAWKRGLDTGIKFAMRERKPSETAIVDLTRVAEEVEEMSASSKDGNQKDCGKTKECEQELDKERAEKRPQIRLGKAKWPDDFLDAFQVQSPSRPIPIKPAAPQDRENSSPVSISPPRKLAIVGRRNESLESLPQFPRRPTHRARHSVDTALAPKDSILRRDVSPDSAPSNRLIPRRSSSKGAPRSNIYLTRANHDDSPSPQEDGISPVPFPRTISGEHSAVPYAASPTLSSSSEEQQAGNSESADKPRPPRGRFQSEIEGSSARRRARPYSYDEMGNKPPRRTRFESMVNLGVGIGSSNASASDLMSRDSLDGSAVRQTLIVREDGKPPTNFQLGNCIGRGQFGSVYRALNLNTGQMVAVKRIRLEGLKEEEVTQLMKEVDLVKSLSHPSIVKYEGMARDENTLSIVLEYVENGSLGQTLKAFGKLNERLVASYVVKILEGLHYLHQSDVVHCDLKAANILTTKNGNVKLSDFGVSLNLRAMEREIKDVAGTPNWMAPEVIELKGASTKSDIWSLACTIIELLTGRPPYGDIANSMTVMFRIVEDDMPPIPEGCSEHLQNFIQLCFNKDPTQRPSAETLFEHDWLKKNWGLHKELRPQDSIPFLRRVSADLQKSDAVRFLSQVDIPGGDSPASENSPRYEEFISGSPGALGRRVSSGPSSPRDVDPISPREHSFVKTTFSKPMTCRVCLLSVKKSAVLCEQCSLIAHHKCAPNAPPTCDLRSQLLLYAQYAEKGTPSNAYSNPLELLNGAHISNSATSPTSEGSFSLPTPRVSIDAPPSLSTPPQGTPPHPPTAFKFMAAFKRSRNSLSPEPGQSSSSLSSPPTPSDAQPARKLSKKQSILKWNPSPRPHSLSSTSTTPNTSSMRSAAESLSTQDAGRVSFVSAADTDAVASSRFSAGEPESRSSQITTVSGTYSAAPHGENGRSNGGPPDTHRQKKRERDSNCTVQ